MKCPHCGTEFWDKLVKIDVTLVDHKVGWFLMHQRCPAENCREFIFFLGKGAITGSPPKNWVIHTNNTSERFMVYPKGHHRPPVPQEVPPNIAEDYNEACLVFPDSKKASAALSRRCLQNLLREHANVKKGNLSNEIQEVIDSGVLPSHLADSIDAIRHVGNFAAHPIKSEKSGEIVPVEPGEAEWLLDVLEALFDFYFVQPAKLKEKRLKLNEKLKETGAKGLK